MSGEKIRVQIEEKMEQIVKEIQRGRDVEIKTCNGGLKILSSDKKNIR